MDFVNVTFDINQSPVITKSIETTWFLATTNRFFDTVLLVILISSFIWLGYVIRLWYYYFKNKKKSKKYGIQKDMQEVQK